MGGDVGKFFGDRLCRPAADARVDLVEDIRLDVARARHTRLDGEHEAAHFAAADDFAERFEGFSGIGRKQKAHAVRPVCAGAHRIVVILVELRRKAGVGDGERAQLPFHLAAEDFRRLLADSGDLAAERGDLDAVFLYLRRAFGKFFVAMGQKVIFRGDLFAVGVDLRHARAVLFFQ